MVGNKNNNNNTIIYIALKTINGLQTTGTLHTNRTEFRYFRDFLYIL